MAVKDTHKAFERLMGAGYSKEMAETLSDSWDTLATKLDIVALRGDVKAVEAATKADIEAVRGDVKALEKETKSDLKVLETALKTDMRELELRMRLHLYAVAIVVIGVLAALELIPR